MAGGEDDWIATRGDWYFLPIAIIPSAPFVFIGFDMLDMGVTFSLVAPVFGVGLLALIYPVAWIISRVKTDRFFRFTSDRVWLPPHQIWLRGRYVEYTKLLSVERYGTMDRYIRINFEGGSRKYNHNIVDVAELEKMVRQRIPRSDDSVDDR